MKLFVPIDRMSLVYRPSIQPDILTVPKELILFLMTIVVMSTQALHCTMPKQELITPMWNNVINDRCRCDLMST